MVRHMVWAACGLVLCCGSVTHGQVSTAEILKRAIVVVAAEEAAGNQILMILVDSVSRGGMKTQTLTLGAGADYRVIAIGDDERIADLDLVVHDAIGRQIGKDDDTSNIAIVNFRAVRTQQYSMTVNPFRMRNNIVRDGFFVLIIVRVD